MDGKLRVPPLPREQKKREQSYIMETKDGALVSVPESKLSAWTQAQKTGSKIPASLRQRAIEEITRELRGQNR